MHIVNVKINLRFCDEPVTVGGSPTGSPPGSLLLRPRRPGEIISASNRVASGRPLLALLCRIGCHEERSAAGGKPDLSETYLHCLRMDPKPTSPLSQC